MASGCSNENKNKTDRVVCMASDNSTLQSSIISERLLRVLACPICKNSLSCNEATGRLHCQRCKQSYPVRDGIPVFLVGEAISEE
jgi:uncharacterized protein YbaR (Trm112 family)